MADKVNIAVIGSGISGISSAFILSKNHNVSLFEKNNYIGGHTNTVTTDENVRVDTGFIVMNDKTYPNLTAFLDKLKINRIKTDMSFGYCDRKNDFYYSTSSLDTIFAQRKNILDLSYYKFLYEIMKFFKLTKKFITYGNNDLCIGQFLELNNFSKSFEEKYILPMASAIWSAPQDKIARFPMLSFANFYNNHGLLSVTDQPQWYFVENGSSSYVDAFLKGFNGKVFKNKKAVSVKQNLNNPEIVFEDSEVLKFDKIIIAAHADEAFKMLENPDPDQVKLLGPWTYSKNRVCLHHDLSFMPDNKRAYASWNYLKEENMEKNSPACITYDMTRLQKLNSEKRYLVTLNPQREIEKNKLIKEIIYTHPVFTRETMETQDKLERLNNKNKNIFFCGSYFGYGFHEDGINSGIKVCKIFGESL
jgi:predicted NAD/FAD-binding protein